MGEIVSVCHYYKGLTTLMQQAIGNKSLPDHVLADLAVKSFKYCLENEIIDVAVLIMGTF
jgi:hypothetical protein